MKNIIYNTLNKEAFEKILNYIKENEDIAKKHFGERYKFIFDYPFVLTYNTAKYIENDVCKCCNQEIKNTDKLITWEDGFRPKISDIVIDLSKVAPVIEYSKIKPHNEQYNIFVKDFFKATKIK